VPCRDAPGGSTAHFRSSKPNWSERDRRRQSVRSHRFLDQPENGPVIIDYQQFFHQSQPIKSVCWSSKDIKQTGFVPARQGPAAPIHCNVFLEIMVIFAQAPES